jgi:predicted Zn-dependent peptidase
MLKKIILNAILITVLFMSGNNDSYTADFNPIKFIQDSLPNGLQIIYHIDKSAPVVSTIVHYRVGSKDENPLRTGFAHFFEHLMFESTDGIKRAEMDKFIQTAGGNLNAHTSFDETVYKMNVPSNQLPLALWIEAQRMRKLHVDSIGVETQRGVVKEERKQRLENQPYGDAFDRICGNLFKGGSYSWTPIGLSQHIDEATIAEFKAFYDNFYQPLNATLVISGDFDINVAKKHIENYFGSYKRVKEPKREPYKMQPITTEIRENIKDNKAQLPAVFIAFRGPNLGAKDYYAAKLLGDILSAGESSRLYQRVVDKEQTAVAVEMENLNLQYSGLMLFIGIAAPGKKIGDVESQILEEIKKIAENGVTAKELEKAKNISEAQFIQSKKNVQEKAQDLAKYYSYYGDAGLINTELDNFMSVNQEDIKAAALKYLNTKNRVVLTYLPNPVK